MTATYLTQYLLAGLLPLAIPDSIREGALALGATHWQVVWDHILPLSLPGILTGTIIGLARAIGETAPLLIIGMVAYI